MKDKEKGKGNKKTGKKLRECWRDLQVAVAVVVVAVVVRVLAVCKGGGGV